MSQGAITVRIMSYLRETDSPKARRILQGSRTLIFSISVVCLLCFSEGVKKSSASIPPGLGMIETAHAVANPDSADGDSSSTSLRTLPQRSGIWITALELSGLPMSGPAWDRLKAEADTPTGAPNLSDQDDPTNVRVLAKALVYARTHDENYRTQVIDAVMAAMGTETGGETLALGRELAAYVIAADLVGVPYEADQQFRAWLREALIDTLEGMTLQLTHEVRPNNWGTHAGASRAAIAAYLGDDAELERTAKVFKGYLGDRASYAGFVFGDLHWQADSNNPVGINPRDATKDGYVIDGAIPDDMRRGGAFKWPPGRTNYPWGAMQGACVQAEILHRAGYDVWNWQDRALLRAAEFLFDIGWEAEGDETWVPWLIDKVYGTSYHGGAPSNPGKNMAWTDWTHADFSVNPRVSTGAVARSADDPAIWIHPNDPSLSVIIGTDKADLPNGGLYVWNLDGSQHHVFPLNTPNNVDVRYAMALGGGFVDIAAASMRKDDEIRIFKIDPLSRTLIDITTVDGIRVFADPYGICLYRRPSDSAMFVFVSNTTGINKKLWQILLEDDGAGKVKGTKVREFGAITDVIEGMVVDDELGYLYASEEKVGVHKYYADSENGDERLALFATGDAIYGDREGIAIYKCKDGTGYILLSSQGNTTVKIYLREGDAGNPHQHTLMTTIDTNGSSATDGLEVTNRPVSAIFPHGFLVTHNSPGKNFNLYGWEDIAQDTLRICHDLFSVPVELATFAAEVKGQDVHLRWVTSTESNNLGFEVQRRLAQGEFQKIAFVTGSGTTSQWRNYSHVDRTLEIGTYFYRLKQIDTDGSFTYSSEIKVVMSAPREFALQDNYPNPFRGQTQIRFQLPQTEDVQLVIYNLLGREVKRLANQKLNAGYHTLSWNALDNSGHPAPNGVYFYKLITPSFSSTRKMVLMR